MDFPSKSLTTCKNIKLCQQVTKQKSKSYQFASDPYSYAHTYSFLFVAYFTLIEVVMWPNWMTWLDARAGIRTRTVKTRQPFKSHSVVKRSEWAHKHSDIVTFSWKPRIDKAIWCLILTTKRKSTWLLSRNQVGFSGWAPRPKKPRENLSQHVEIHASKTE